MTDKQLTVVNSSLSEDDDDNKPAPYQQRKTDMNLIDAVLTQMQDRLQTERNVRPSVRRDAITLQEGIQQIGKAGEAFHDLPTESQTGLLFDMLQSPNLEIMAEKGTVALGLKPMQPSAPVMPQFGFVPMGPGMGGGMGGMAPMAPPQPTPPGGFPPSYYPPQQGAPQYPYPPYPPHGEYQTGQQGNAYAQPHAYPSYPHPHPGYPPHHGQPPGYPPYYPPQGPAGYQPYPPQQPQHGAAPHHPGQQPPPQDQQAPVWPPQPDPVVIDAETEDVKKDNTTQDNQTS